MKQEILLGDCLELMKDIPSRFSILETLDLIKEQTGLELELCDYFTGIKEHNGKEMELQKF